MRLLKIFLLSLVTIFAVSCTPIVNAQVLINSYQFNTAEVEFDSDYQAVLDRATTLDYTKPSAGQQIKQNQLVLDLKADGIWTLLDILYVFATDGDSDYATLNWKDPTAFQCSKVNSPAFTENEGFVSNGTSSYLSTNFNPRTQGVNYIQNDASMGGAVLNDFVGSSTFIGGLYSGGPGLWLNPKNVSDQFGSRLNNSGPLVLYSNTDATGFYCVNRPSSTTYIGYKNGVLKATVSQMSEAIVSADLPILSRLTDGTYQGFMSESNVPVFFMGAAMSEELNVDIYNTWNVYYTSL